MHRTKFAVILGAFYLAGVLTSEGLRWFHSPAKKAKPVAVSPVPAPVVAVRERPKFSTPELRGKVPQRMLDEHKARMAAPTVGIDLQTWEGRRMVVSGTHKELFVNQSLLELHLRVTALEGWAAQQ